MAALLDLAVPVLAFFGLACLLGAIVNGAGHGCDDAASATRPGPSPAAPALPPVLRDAPRARTVIDGRAFEFAFADQGGVEGWRIYILRQPPYEGRCDGPHDSHRYHDRALGLRYVCLADAVTPVKELGRAGELAWLWAGGTVRYIQTGRPF